MTETTAPAIPAIERTLHLAAPPDRVWRAITDPAELSRWFPDTAELDLRVGGSGRFTWKEYGTAQVRVEAIDEPDYFAWSWADMGDPEKEAWTLVEWRLQPGKAGGTTLTVRESGFTRPEKRAENEGGWTSELAELVELLS